MKKVMVFGTFDGLHMGHRSLFQQARKYGDYVIAVVARDSTVKKVKDHIPLEKQEERLRQVRDCPGIDEARLGYEDDQYRVIFEVKPDVICLGYDQRAFVDKLAEKIEKSGLHTKIYRMKPYQPGKYHSSLLGRGIRTSIN